MKIKIENNAEEILQYLEELNHVWLSGCKPTQLNPSKLGATYIKIRDDNRIEWGTGNNDGISLKEFMNSRRDGILLPGNTIILENGNSFEVKSFQSKRIIFPKGSSYSVFGVEDFCNHDMSPKKGVSRIMLVINEQGETVWERGFSRSDIKAGYTLKNELGIKYLVVTDPSDNLRILLMDKFVVGALVSDIMDEDGKPSTSKHYEIIEVRDDKNRIIYSKA